MQEQVKKTMEALAGNGFEPFYFETAEEALEALYNEISPEETVGIGGSMTIINMGVREKRKSGAFGSSPITGNRILRGGKHG